MLGADADSTNQLMLYCKQHCVKVSFVSLLKIKKFKTTDNKIDKSSHAMCAMLDDCYIDTITHFQYINGNIYMVQHMLIITKQSYVIV